MRVVELEKDHQTFKKHQEKKIKDILNSCKQKPKKGKGCEDSVPEENVITCDVCDYTTTSRQGLKIHNSKVHSKINFKEFPAMCDICEKVLDNEINLKKHKKDNHTFN